MMKEHGLTQQALSEKLLNMGVSAQLDTIKSWFRKNPKTRHSPKIEALQAMAEIFDVTIDDLIKKRSYKEPFVPTRVKSGKVGINELNENKNFTLNLKNLRDDFSQNLSSKNKNAAQENLINLANISTKKTLTQTALPHRLQSQTANHFLNLFSEFGNDALLLPVIKKLEKIKKISEK